MNEPLVVKDLSKEGVLTLTLNRPHVKNALDGALMRMLYESICDADTDEKIRILILRGAGGFFCAGADIQSMKQAAVATRAENQADAQVLASLLRALAHCSKPTLAVVEGGAFGGGVGLVAACDLAIAAPQAIFSLSEVRLGLIPAVISPYVKAAIGERQAKKLTLTAERFSAQEAYRLGLIMHLQGDISLETLTNHLLKGGPQAQSAAKKLFRSLHEDPFLDTASLIADIRVSAEGQEGLRAFLEKRLPLWSQDIPS